MEKIYYITLLYDFYSELLTDKQQSVLQRYYLDDLSLNEVAQEHDITRQAVQDMLKRTEKLLQQYEDKLCLVTKYLERKKKIDDIGAMLDELGDSEKVSEIKQRVFSILD